MFQQANRILFAVIVLAGTIMTASAQTNLTAKANGFQPQPTTADGGDSDRARDGLVGPVRRVRTEVVKLSTASGKITEDSKRVLLETAEYDLKGTKTQNQYFPLEGVTLTGREVYKYDDKGNISEMTLVNADGSLVSKEVYKYEYDSIGNWVKMTTSLAVVENGRVGFEPTEVTYRTIFYYLDASMSKMLEPASPSSNTINNTKGTPDAKPESTASSNGAVRDDKVVAILPPTTTLAKPNLSTQSLAVAPATAQLNLGEPAAVAVNDAPPPRPLLRPLSSGVLNGKALSLPAPSYPDGARRMHMEGTVEVEVVLDENGKVISARAVSGPAVFRDVAVQAAYRARFSPTKLSGQPVKVSGQINYKFTIPH